MGAFIALQGLSKSFGSLKAVDSVSFTVNQGEVLGFLGPNGAGKSTTMKMIAGFLSPSAGKAAVCGFDVVRDPLRAKAQMGYLPEGAPAYPDMTAAAFLDFIGAIRGFDGAERRKRIALAVERANLKGVLHQPIDTLSKGYRRRVGLAQALLHDPKVLVLDEPTDGLDPNQKHEVRTLIEAMAPQKAIIVSTHILEEVEAVCTRAIVIAHGRVVADGTPAELAARDPQHNAIVLRLRADAAGTAAKLIGGLSGVARIEAQEGREETILIVHPHPGAQAPMAELAMLGRSEPWGMTELKLERGRLDNVFRAITRSAGSGAAR
jgi:ABC-2 type transport system ATP-binding protein